MQFGEVAQTFGPQLGGDDDRDVGAGVRGQGGLQRRKGGKISDGREDGPPPWRAWQGVAGRGADV